MKNSIAYTTIKMLLSIGLSVLLTVLTGVVSYGQNEVDCNTNLACINSIQVSLDENCEATIYADLLMQDPGYDNDSFLITLTTPQDSVFKSRVVAGVSAIDGGDSVVHPKVYYRHKDMEIQVSVQLRGCASSCLGMLTVEDKLPPVISGCGRDTVNCTINLEPKHTGSVLDYPLFLDACSDIKDTTWFDTHNKQLCDGEFSDVIYRLWTVSDNDGNKAQCYDTIYVKRLTLDSVVFPRNFDDFEEQAFTCESIKTISAQNIDENGAPKPSITGSPSGMACHNIQVHYEDLQFDICGASVKYVRTWLVVDWCTGRNTTGYQTIKVLDKTNPVCMTNSVVDTISTDEGLCVATYNVPAPNVTDCSDWTYTVSYKKKDASNDPYNDTWSENITGNANSGYIIHDLPRDTFWVAYRIEDACGNISRCSREVIVKDMEAPTPVCEGFTVIGLDDSGWADLYAESIDDGSNDNCGIVKYEVRRDTTYCDSFMTDLQYGEKVNFCCNDVGKGYVTVFMRVYDAAGNFNDCRVNVKVEDKIAPIIFCPKDTTVNCTADYENLDVFGRATAFDNCEVEITHTDIKNVNDCNIGTILRTWSATDPQGKVAKCTQQIHLVDLDPFGRDDITWPSDKEISCAYNATPEELNSKPIITNRDCAKVNISYKDQTFYVDGEDYCRKLVRTWRVADWCSGDSQNPTYYIHVQKLIIVNDIKPTIKTQCVNKTITPEEGVCEATIDESIEAEDDCTPEALLKYSYTIDYYNDGSIDESRNRKYIRGTYPTGSHKVTWYVEDECGNVQECSYLITIKDTKAPTPICLGIVTWTLDENGQTVVWASDFNLKSDDTCGDNNLKYSFNAAGTQPSKSFTCADIPNGIAAAIPLTVYVIDAGGNSEYCDVTLMLQDSKKNNACIDKEQTSGIIAGKVVNSDDVGLSDVKMELEGIDHDIQHVMTKDGEYTFKNVEYYDSYKIAPILEGDVLNGVNTLDLVLIQRHLLEIKVFNNPIELIAADINNDKKLSSSDLLALRKVILGMDQEFYNNSSWRFLPADIEFTDPNTPFSFSEAIEIDEMYFAKKDADFYAVKVGDVNKSVSIQPRSSSSMNLLATIPSFTTNDVFKVDFRAEDIDAIIGTQMALTFDANIATFAGIESGILDFKEDFLNIDKVGNGELSLAWAAVNAKAVNSDEVLFSIVFEAKKAMANQEAFLALGTNIIAEAYDGEFITKPVELRTQVVSNDKTGTFSVYQNTPNPFSTQTKIAFYQSERKETTLSVYDITGKIIMTQQKMYDAGSHEIMFSTDGKEIQGGVLYYKIQSGNEQITRKMVVIK